MRPRELGSSTVLISAVVALLASLSMATAGLALAYGARAQAQTAADAAALAAAVATYPPAAPGSPHERAKRLARLNGARLVSCHCPVDPRARPRVITVEVAVDVDVPIFGVLDVVGTARAEFDPGRWLGQ